MKVRLFFMFKEVLIESNNLCMNFSYRRLKKQHLSNLSASFKISGSSTF